MNLLKRKSISGNRLFTFRKESEIGQVAFHPDNLFVTSLRSAMMATSC
jgi:hypothetical protein